MQFLNRIIFFLKKYLKSSTVFHYNTVSIVNVGKLVNKEGKGEV
jgi:hypothetical protein